MHYYEAMPMIQEKKVKFRLLTKNLLCNNKKTRASLFIFFKIKPLKIGKKLCEITLVS